jgi:hypothetical protein
LAPIFIGKIAGNGNRTRMASLEGWNFTIKLCPRSRKLALAGAKAKRFFMGRPSAEHTYGRMDSLRRLVVVGLVKTPEAV